MRTSLQRATEPLESNLLADLAIWNCRKCGSAFEPKAYQRKKSDRTCRACLTAQAVVWQRKRRAQGLDVNASRANWSAERRAADRAYGTWSYHNNPERKARCIARAVARRAIRTGRLVRLPCEACGAEPTDAHHDDYSKPLDVRWLCRPCHLAHHAAERSAMAA